MSSPQPPPNPFEKSEKARTKEGIILFAVILTVLAVWAISTLFGISITTAFAIYILALLGIAVMAILSGLSPF